MRAKRRRKKAKPPPAPLVPAAKVEPKKKRRIAAIAALQPAKLPRKKAKPTPRVAKPARRKARVHRAPAVRLARSTSVDDAMATIFPLCRDHWKSNLPAVRGGRIAALHQMRVGLRRFRTALRLFRDYLPEAHYEYFSAESKAVSEALGRVRDLDVFIENLEHTGKLARDPNVAAVNAAAIRARSRGRSAVAAALRGARYRRFMALLDRWIAGRRWQAADKRRKDGSKALGRFATRVLNKRWSKVRKGVKGIDQAAPETVHDLRIVAKKARYAFEFLGSVLPDRPVKRAERRLRQLQEALGRVNDVAVAKRLMKELTVSAAGRPRRRAIKAGRRKLATKYRAVLKHGISKATQVGARLRLQKTV
jgi:CHAD domain-containing protein